MRPAPLCASSPEHAVSKHCYGSCSRIDLQTWDQPAAASSSVTHGQPQTAAATILFVQRLYRHKGWRKRPKTNGNEKGIIKPNPIPNPNRPLPLDGRKTKKMTNRLTFLRLLVQAPTRKSRRRPTQGVTEPGDAQTPTRTIPAPAGDDGPHRHQTPESFRCSSLRESLCKTCSKAQHKDTGEKEKMKKKKNTHTHTHTGSTHKDKHPIMGKRQKKDSKERQFKETGERRNRHTDKHGHLRPDTGTQKQTQTRTHA